MKALLLNSGVGSRMTDLATCKCLVELADGETIIDAQIKSMLRCGITDFVVTTGPYADVLEAHLRKRYDGANFTFVNNPVYSQTNYIYSIYLARDLLFGHDVLLVHGDLVYEQNVLQDVLAARTSAMVVDTTRPLPKKDFKAVVVNGYVKKVCINTFTYEGGTCLYAQPMYKLLQKDWAAWLDEISRFCEQGDTKVYAENALNNISDIIKIAPLDITGRMCFEVDNKADLEHACAQYNNMPDRLQAVYSGYDSCRHAREILSQAKHPFVVCGIDVTHVRQILGDDATYFTGFTPNPEYHEVIDGIALFIRENCDFIVSIGGGSAIDVAKCINGMSDNGKLLDSPRVRHLAIPTTAGTGSESTCFAVLYKNGEKLSIENEGLLPDYVVLDPHFLHSLPVYHKKSSLLDAYAQAVESLWAKGRTPASKSYALAALQIIRSEIKGYMLSDMHSVLQIMHAANLSGKAINIGKTTAAHAMSYRLSSIMDIAHGHAVALCLPVVWMHYLGACVAGERELSIESCRSFIEVLNMLDMPEIDSDSINLDDAIVELVDSVNPLRLSNHPVQLTSDVLAKMYKTVLQVG